MGKRSAAYLEAFSRRLREAMATKQLSQADLARLLAANPSDARAIAAKIWRWCNGDHAPDLEILPKLSEVLGVSIEYLLTGEEGGEAKAYAAAARAEKERKEWQAEALRLRGELERVHAQLGLILPGRSAPVVEKPRPGPRRGPTKQ